MDAVWFLEPAARRRDRVAGCAPHADSGRNEKRIPDLQLLRRPVPPTLEGTTGESTRQGGAACRKARRLLCFSGARRPPARPPNLARWTASSITGRRALPARS